jgi:ankyrin repeat protein
MSRLPDRPNFEHLKKQAKDLLRAYEARDPEARERFRKAMPFMEGKEAKLHDAQSCIAREYDLPSWQALKNHVDWRNARLSKDRKDVVPLWLHLVYGHQEDNAQPLQAARALEEDPDLVQGDLFLACAIGDEETVKRAIAADPAAVNRTRRDWQCPGCKDWLDMPPLVAVTQSSLFGLPQYRDRLARCARLLLDAGADPNQSWKHGGGPPLSALYGAAGKAHDPEVTKLLLDAGANPNDGESLYHAIESPSLECVRLLLEAGARTKEANAICHMLDKSDLEGLQLILQYAPGVEDRELLWAIRRARDRAHVEALLKAGANPHAKTQEGISAFRFAMQMGLPEVADALRAAGAGEDLTAPEQFVAACAAVNETEARRILKEHPDVIGELTEAQLKQLPQLIESGKHDAVRLMVRLGWPIAVRGGDWGATALNHAVYQGNPVLARFLLEHGAHWDEENNYGNVLGILAWASRNVDSLGQWPDDYVGCARVLLEFGAPLLDINGYYSEEMETFLAEERAKRGAA